MANFEIDEDQAALIRELRKLETSDPVHANVYNALFEKLINNDAFLERLANKMVEKSMLCHVLDSVNAQQVLAADVGPKITAIIDGLQEDVSVLNTKIIKAPDYKNYKSVSLPFTAPNDGYICGGVYSLGTAACYIYVNSTQVGWNHSGGGSNTASPFMYPLSKGDIVTAIGYDQFRAYFIYTK